MNLAGIIQRLSRERDRARAELHRLDAAIMALGAAGRSGFRQGQRRGRRKVSAAARARMAAAQGREGPENGEAERRAGENT